MLSEGRNWNDDRREEVLPPGRSLVTATVVVGAVYTYFLVFAQFGFLHALPAVLGDKHPWLRLIMGFMATAGIAGGFFAAKVYTDKNGRPFLRAGFVIAALAAALTWVARGPLVFFAAALLTGAGLGLVTVSLAALLRREIGGTQLGRCIGTGTGVAYAISSLPEIFAGAHGIQLLVGIIAAGVGLLASQRFGTHTLRQQANGPDYDRTGVALWIALFLVLVSFDSGVFFLLQHQPALQPAWPAGGGLYLNSVVHVLAAVLAGLALDRRWITGTVLAGAALLMGAAACFAFGPPATWMAQVYSAGVSIYSVALVFYPARRGDPKLAAGLYAVAGWTGSAVGITVAENLDHLPRMLPLAAGLVIAGLLTVRARRK